jgi:hypothetical protein
VLQVNYVKLTVRMLVMRAVMFLSVTTWGLLVELSNEWAIQLLVLFSFALQVFLLMFASIRRHKVSKRSRLFLWLAYQLADSTALFTLGHLSISSKLKEHELVAFWAPLLLVHLGGQDTITAYSAEDNGIWLRHLQTLIVQVMGAAYVLYKYIPDSETLVIAASILIFIVGVLKYAERIWALKSASMDSIWSSLDTSENDNNNGRHDRANGNELLGKLLSRRHGLGVEEVLMTAHILLDVCKGLFIGLRRVQRGSLHDVVESFKMCGRLDELMEMELSLMYDIMYTKAVVIHTWYGCFVRVVAPLATVTTFILFLITGKEKYSRQDVIISYVLLVGALVLEAVSVVRAAGSTWTAAWLYDRKYHWLHDELRALRQVIGAADYRRWSGSVGQYNLLLSCAQGKGRDPPKLLGLRHIADYWAKQPTKVVSATTKELVLRELLRIAKQGKETARSTGAFPGLLTLQLYKMEELIGWSIQDFRFEDSIIAWHVATEICLFKDRSGKAILVDATRLLSNYMMFLLVRCPYMLPGPVSHSPCHLVRKALCKLMNDDAAGGAATPQEKRLEWARSTGFHDLGNTFDAPPGEYDHAGVRIADMLYHRHNRLEVIFGVWVEMLCYVADHCSRESHSRQLCRGGELVTIVWLMARHAEMYYS